MPHRRLREYWQEFSHAEPGQRFRLRYRRRQAERLAGATQWSRFVQLFFATLSIVIAIPLMVLPGPAVVFWLLAGFLIAGESQWVATAMDNGELLCRRLGSRMRRRRR